MTLARRTVPRAGPAALFGGGCTGGRARRRTGFTLSEILIATAILGVGLVMIIAVFPVAIEQNKDSTADTLGTIICENGLAQLKAGLSHPLFPPGTGDTFDPSFVDTTEVRYLDGNYPVGVSGANRGFLVLPRQPDANRNEYQFVIVSYVKSDPGNKARAFNVTMTASGLDSNQMTFNASPAGQLSFLKVGSPVIDPTRGRYATIVSVTPAGPFCTVTLDRPLCPGTTGQKITSAIVIAETDAGNNPIAGILFSPATRVMTARASLRQ